MSWNDISRVLALPRLPTERIAWIHMRVGSVVVCHGMDPAYHRYGTNNVPQATNLPTMYGNFGTDGAGFHVVRGHFARQNDRPDGIRRKARRGFAPSD
jgi:anaerobic selenocysteine-containing dehydrogenase